ncbi:sensor histidine kinase [Microbacterium pullorum]|uniref:sensor histidine kinase n=1 Tax=Microbacterium pullorum TaxID=2762236 RepID=UPI00177E137F|nr:histidine kinase [Microbacterium pullorum]
MALLIAGCAGQAASLLLADRWPGWTVALTTLTYLTLAIGLAVPSWLTGMYLVIALALFLLSTRSTPLRSALWALAVIAFSMGALLIWLVTTGTSYHVAFGYVLGETARFSAPAAGAAALGIWWGVQIKRITLAREEAARVKEEHARRIGDAQRAERTRIAQDLHDVAGQHLAGLITLSDAALAIARDRPGQALKLIREVRREGQFAAASISGVLSDLRATGTEATTITANLSRVPELAGYWRRIGMAVEVSFEGNIHEVPAVVSSIAFRSLQEALTNAAKHAPGSAVAVSISAGDDQLKLHVVNTSLDVRARPLRGMGLGWGIGGIRERVELVHGTLSAGETDSGRWELLVTIPITPDSN